MKKSEILSGFQNLQFFPIAYDPKNNFPARFYRGSIFVVCGLFQNFYIFRKSVNNFSFGHLSALNKAKWLGERMCPTLPFTLCVVRRPVNRRSSCKTFFEWCKIFRISLPFKILSLWIFPKRFTEYL